MKRVVRSALALVALFVVAGAAALWLAGRAGSSAVETWVAGQIHLVADGYLNPKLSFTDLDYQFPATVRLKSLRLTADDPANPGRSIDIVGCERAEIELTEMPKAGRPIQIASIAFRKPVFQAIAVGDGSKRLVGFSDLIRKPSSEVTTQPAQSPEAASQPAEYPQPPSASPATTALPHLAANNVPRLSDFLRMTRVELIDGQIISDARLPGVPRMQIDKINTRLAIEPAKDGWYTLDTRITRAPVFDLALTGRLNLDTFTAADAVVTVKAHVAREEESFLPPDLQTFLRRHEVRGALEARITARSLPLLDPGRGAMSVEASLANANVAYRDYRVPVESLVLSAALEDGMLKLSKLDVKALRGEADVRGTLALNEALDADVRCVVRNMILDDTIRDGTATAREPKFGGRVNAQVAAAAPLKTAATTLPIDRTWGRGQIDVDRGRLVNIPLVQGLGRAITKSTTWLRGGGRGGARGKGAGTDRAHVVFTLVGHEARCSEMTYVGDVFAARGRGVVAFDQELDLIVNGGPLEKMQHLLGKHVGGVFGKLTDALAGYRVTGTVAQPQVGVQLAGGRVNNMGRSVKNGFGKVVDGMSNLAGAGE